MNNKITCLGASDLSLAMIMEVIGDQIENPDVTVVKNTDHSFSYPFKIQSGSLNVIQSDNWGPDDHRNFLLGVNKPETKRLVYEYFRNQFKIEEKDYRWIMHSSSVLATTTKPNNGIVIHPLSVVSAHSTLAPFVTLNRGVTVGHHTSIGAFSTIHPGVNIAGCCKIGNGVTIGMGANIIDGTSIGNGSVIGAGSTVTRDIPDSVVAYGQPAKIIRTLEHQFNN